MFDVGFGGQVRRGDHCLRTSRRGFGVVTWGDGVRGISIHNGWLMSKNSDNELKSIREMNA